MAKMSDMSTFQIVIMGIFGGSVVVAIALFAFSDAIFEGEAAAVPVEIWGVMDERSVQNWVGSIEDELERAGIEIVYQSFPQETFDEQLVNAMAINEGPDMAIFSQDQLAHHRDRIIEVPFSTFSEREFRDSFVRSTDVFLNREEGFVYGLPLLVDPLVMYWNRPLISAEGYARPPERWGDFSDFVADVSDVEDDGRVTLSGAALGEYENIRNAKAVLSTLIHQAGGAIMEGTPADLDPTIGDGFDMSIRPAVSSLLFYTDFADPQRSMFTWDRGLSSDIERFADEELIVYFGKASDLEDIEEINPFLEFDVGTVPESSNGNMSSYASIAGLSILRSTNSTGASLQAARVLTSPTSLEILSQEQGGVPPARSGMIANPPSNPFYAPVFYDAAARSFSWIDPAPRETDVILRSMVESVVDRELNVETAVGRAGSQLDDLVGGL